VSLLKEMAERLPGCRLTPIARGARLVFEVDGCWLSGRIREDPLIEVFLRTTEVPGFELGLDRDGVDTSDGEMADLWLDAPAREALAAPLAEGYRYKLERGEVIVLRGTEPDVDRLVGAVRAGGVLAARPNRIADAWLEVARGLGGTTTTDRWDLARDFAVTVDRGAVEVRIDTPGEPLRTRVHAARLGAADEVFPLARVADLLAAAQPTGTGITAGVVELSWHGLVMDPARLGPAVEICARLAAPSIAATGPYR
jgi:hypothetical protein